MYLNTATTTFFKKQNKNNHKSKSKRGNELRRVPVQTPGVKETSFPKGSVILTHRSKKQPEAASKEPHLTTGTLAG